MAAVRSQGQRPSPKRRKLDHLSEADESHFSEISVAIAGNENLDGGMIPALLNGHAGKSQPGRTSRPSHATASKPIVLPTGGINKSAILALQLSDLDAEITPDYERLRSKWSNFVDRLVSLIKSIPQRAPVTATEASKAFRKQGIRIPWPHPPPSKQTNYKFEWATLKDIVVGGALSHGLSIKHENVVDVSAIMPPDVLQDKDYLNHRVLHKAAFYLACVAEAIKTEMGAEFDTSFEWMDDVELWPTINVVSKDAKLSKFTFRVSIGAPYGAIPIEKTLPTKNCLRQLQSSDSTEEQPTPFYNSAVCHLAAISNYDSRIRSAVQETSAFAEACHIGQLWLRQRDFSSSVRSGGFGANEWSLTCTLLLERGGHQDRPLFSKQYSSLQLFKAMLQILAGRNLQKQPMLLFGTTKFELSDFDAPVLYDGTTGVNILYKMSPSSYQSLRHHAQISLASLNSKSQDSFDATFALNVAVPLLQYDEIFSIKISPDHFHKSGDERQFLHKMHKVLVRGLGDRASLVNFKLPPASSWALSQDPHKGKNDYELEIGLLTNPDNVARLVDHGPSADDQDEATDFRQFWGEKAELRRFKDGSISEALVWSAGAPVTLQVIAYLAMLHFKLPPSSIESKTHDLSTTVLGDDDSSAPVIAKDAFRLINSTFQTLTSTLHNLEGLPLPIRSISPASSALRSCSALHPLQPSTISPIDILIQFDSSTRWPDSLPAIQYTKIAFLLKLSELLAQSKGELTTRVGLENTDSATSGHFNTSFLDIVSPSPAPGLSPICFRLRIYHDREAHLLQTALADKSLHGSVRDSLALALAIHKRDFQAKTIHTLTMRNLITRFPPLSDTVRLLKRWISSHLVANHVPEEILEIIAAQVFLHPVPWSTPGSATTAFLRCLQVLARWDWAISPLIIDLSVSQDGVSGEQRAEMETRFQAWRKLDPNMNNVVWFVGSSVDRTGTAWTGNARPSRVVAGRVTALAKAAVGVVEEKGTGMEDGDWRGLFQSPTTDYDFVIHLRPSVVRGYKAKKDKAKTALNGNGEFKNLQIAEALDVDSIGYDPVELYLHDLEHAFGSSALFFYDKYGGKLIAGLWRPSVLGRKEWRVRLGWSSVPVPSDGDSDKEMCIFNKEATVAEMVNLGVGLAKSVKVKE
ncbi:U3 snoRNP protein [Cladophialophora chaetospira]|uniref:U3 small nucleolar RNA-associated protein 22 n=1 Tax=Cladophialophora chaetospira TaxID=386627 RepID=A0AA38WZR0_9EURO|nr:U3 snoRNP protein [Cladophialophora chaetospira]